MTLKASPENEMTMHASLPDFVESMTVAKITG